MPRPVPGTAADTDPTAKLPMEPTVSQIITQSATANLAMSKVAERKPSRFKPARRACELASWMTCT